MNIILFSKTIRSFGSLDALFPALIVDSNSASIAREEESRVREKWNPSFGNNKVRSLSMDSALQHKK